jgi:hypothetical protein
MALFGVWTDAMSNEINQQEEIILAAIISVLFMTFGFLLLRSFRKKQKLYNNALDSEEWQSKTYARFPSICEFILKGQINGFGAEGFTKHNLQEDGSFEIIQWFTIAYFPIIPLMQHRVTESKTIKKSYIPFLLKGEKTCYLEIEKTKLNSSLIKKTRLFYYGLVAPLMILPIILVLINLPNLLVKFPGLKFWYLLLFYFVLGIVLLFLADFFNQKVFLKKRYRVD